MTWYFVVKLFISSVFLPQSAAVLKKLGDQVSKKNVKKDPITDGEVDVLEKSLQTVLDSFNQLADFKQTHSEKITILKEMPVDKIQVFALQVEMP